MTAVAASDDPVLDGVFHALADATRRSMVVTLADGRERTISELCAPFDMSFAAVSKHVRVLERAGVVARRVHGRQHFCRMRPEALAHADTWLSFYTQFWRSRLDELENLLDEEA